MLMASATTNLFLLDSRRTKQSMVMQADLLKEELTIPAMHFVLNRAGYTPSIFEPLAKIFQQLKQQFVKRYSGK
jgi:hypothetical protein